MKLREFLTEEKWCKGSYAVTKSGDITKFNSPFAVKFSILGSVHVLYPENEDYLKAVDRLASLIRILHGKRIEEFNDSATWDEVKHIIFTVDL